MSSPLLSRAAMPRFLDASVGLMTKLYRLFTIVILAILLGGMALYVAYFLYFLFGKSWGMPAILSPAHERVMLVQGTLADRTLKVADLKDRPSTSEKLLRQLREEARQAKLTLDSLETFRTNDLKSIEVELALTEKSLEASRAEILASRSLLIRLTTEARPEEELRRQLIDRTRYLAELTLRQNLSQSIVTTENAVRTLEIQRLTALRRQEKTSGLANRAGEDQERLVLKAKAEFLLADYPAQEAALETMIEQMKPFIETLNTQIALLKASPAGQAGDRDVVAVFIPYDNLRSAKAIPLYGCALQILFCSEIGVMETTQDAEIALPHPLFGKPVRGTLYVARISRDDARRSLVFTTRPLFF